MKSTIPVLAIPVLAALVLVACNQKSPINSTETPSPNSRMGNANGMMDGTTNMRPPTAYRIWTGRQPLACRIWASGNSWHDKYEYAGNSRHVEYGYAGTSHSIVDGLCDLTDFVKDSNKILAREITDPAVYFNRRTFIRTGILAASAVATGLVYRRLNHVATGTVDTPLIQGLTTPAAAADATGFRVSRMRRPPSRTSRITIISMNSRPTRKGLRRRRLNLRPKAGRCRSRAW